MVFACVSSLLDCDLLEGRNHALLIFVYPEHIPVPSIAQYMVDKHLFICSFNKHLLGSYSAPRDHARHYEQ